MSSQRGSLRLLPRLALLAFAAAALARSASAQVPVRSLGRPILQNQFVIVRETRLQTGIAPPGRGTHDLALVYLEGEAVGQVRFVERESAVDLEQGRVVLIELQDIPMTAYPNESGYPRAFPRPGAVKVLENDRVTVWDYTFTRDVPSPMHFHDQDVVVVFLGDGALASTTPDGTVTVSDHTDGLTRFNPGNRLHTETLVRGSCRVIVVELK